jgi:hypothetical protein
LKDFSHKTATELGALVKYIIPDTPNLHRACELRASEMIQTLIHNPWGSRGDGIFVDQVGADGTSILAATTSDNHLDCMQARYWPDSAAKSLLVELVKEQQREHCNGDAADPLSIRNGQPYT